MRGDNHSSVWVSRYPPRHQIGLRVGRIRWCSDSVSVKRTTRHRRFRQTEKVRIDFIRGDITEQSVDTLVNAANHSLLGGGGVDGAIHRKGGPDILAECKRIRAERYPQGLPTGESVATTGGDLPARWVIHTVGPTWDKTKDKSPLLRSCYATSLAVADGLS